MKGFLGVRGLVPAFPCGHLWPGPADGSASFALKGGDESPHSKEPAAQIALPYLLSFLFFPSLLPAQAPDDPATELASFKIAAGFEANVFASEADGVVKPIQIRFDARGRLWVIGSTVYPQIAPGQEPNDKVLILEDTDGDGRSDKTTVFADGLMIPTGLETLADGSGCYVGHGTELLLLKDRNGDGKADTREVVLRGFGTGDNHQNINSFAWGPSGELWFCQGLHSHARVETPFGLVKLDQAGIWRLNTRTLKLEGFYGSAAEPQNPWGFVFTDWGEPIELAGNNHSIIYPVPGLVKHPKPAQPTLIWPTGRGRKMSGGEIVGTAHFPDAWQGHLIVGGYINNAIWTMTLHDDGAGFLLKDAEPLITSTHGSFRPVDVKFGPDGALYLCDWYNPIIGHYQASFRHPNRDKTHGRIWRVTAKGRALTPNPKLTDEGISDLISNLGSPDRWTRHFSKRLLSEGRSESVEAALHKGALSNLIDAGRFQSRYPAEDAKRETQRHFLATQELGLLESMGRLSDSWLVGALGAQDRNMQANVARTLGRNHDKLPEANVLRYLSHLVCSENARVRLHAIVACTYVDTAEAVEVALMAADRPTDKFIEYALEQAVFSLKPKWLPEFQAGRLTFDHQPDRLSAFVRADGTADTLVALRKLMQSDALDSGTRRVFLNILAEAGDASDLATILALDEATLAQIMPAAVRAVQRRGLRPAGNLAALVRSLLSSGDGEVRDGASRLAGAWRLDEFKPALIESAGSSPAAFEGLLSLDLTAAVAKAAEMLAASKDGAVATILLPALFQRQGAPEALVRAIETTKPTPAAAAAGVRLLRERGLTSLPLTEALSAAAGLPAPRWTYSPGFAARLAAEVRASGDTARGREIYRRPELTCTACHAINNEGGKIGPSLDAIGSAQPVDFIIGAVLAPQKEIKESFEAVQVTTKAGEVIVGHRAGSSGRELVLRDPASGQFTRLKRETVAAEKNLGSLMPAGLVDALDPDELRDLICYLSELGKPKP
jgi:putative heme-binding domain-containing protein